MLNHRNIKLFVGLVSTIGLTPATHAGVIHVPPMLVSSNLAANVPAQQNVYIGLAQSFTTQDPNVTFGFYVFLPDLTPGANPVSMNLLYSLYSGDGTFTTLLSQRPATLSSGTAFSPTLLSVDFSNTNLVVNAKYTVALTLATQSLPAVGTLSNASALYAGTNSNGNPNPYLGGTFYIFGSSFNPGSFADRDLAFRVTPVPEPSAFTLLAGGLGFFAFARASTRRRITTAA